MIISQGEKIYVVLRRLFEGEIRRHFVGEVIEVSGSIVRLHGNTIIFDTVNNTYIKKPEIRTTIIDLAESGYIVNIISQDVAIDELHYVINQDKKLVVTDGKDFSLDINEFNSVR